MDTFHIIIITAVIFYILTCLAFFDIARKDFGSTAKKAVWRIIAFIPFIGVVIYMIFGYSKGKKPDEK